MLPIWGMSIKQLAITGEISTTDVTVLQTTTINVGYVEIMGKLLKINIIKNILENGHVVKIQTKEMVANILKRA